jgi:hypothetical protein
LFQLAKSKIENLSSDDELNRGWFYLAKAAQHGHTDSINLITTLINTAKSSIANDAFKTDHSTKNLIHLRVAADAGYEPAAHYLAENFEQAMRAPLPLNDQDFNTVMPFIDSASDAGYVPAIAYYNNHVNNG